MSFQAETIGVLGVLYFLAINTLGMRLFELHGKILLSELCKSPQHTALFSEQSTPHIR